MKLSHALTLVGLGLGALGAAAASQGCSSSSSGGTTGGGSTGGPPSKPAGAATTTSTAEHNYALYSLFLGDTDRKGTPSNNAWKDFGYNLDGKVTTKDSTDVCTQSPGANKTQQADGTNGIDNSFGENILPIVISTAGSDAASKINNSIKTGSFTIMIDTVGLDDANPAQTATGLTGRLYAGANFTATPANMGKMPTFTTADHWPVRPELLDSPTDVTSTKVKFPDAFVTNGTYVTGDPPGTLTLSLAFGGVALDLTVRTAVVTFDHKAAGSADNGTIAGIINTQELIDGLKKVAGRISTSLCSGSAFQSIASEIQQASDIMTDGTNAHGSACNAISIGLGFTAKEIAPPANSDIAAFSAMQPDPCAAGDGGTTEDSGGGGSDSGGGGMDGGTD